MVLELAAEPLTVTVLAAGVRSAVDLAPVVVAVFVAEVNSPELELNRELEELEPEPVTGVVVAFPPPSVVPVTTW